MQVREVNFDTNVYPYRLLNGAVIQTGGNPNRCLESTSPESPRTRIRIDLSASPITVTNVRFDTWKSGVFGVQQQVRLYNRQGILLATPVDLAQPGANGFNSWQTVNQTLSINNTQVSYVVFDVKPADEWCYTFDFATGSQGWSPQRPPHFGGTSGTFTGSRWVNGSSYGFDATIIQRSFVIPEGTTLHSLEWTGGTGNRLSYFGYYINNGYAGAPYVADGQRLYGGTTLNLIGPTTVLLAVEISVPGGDTSYIDSVTVRGTGSNPFASDNCLGDRVIRLDNCQVTFQDTGLPAPINTGEGECPAYAGEGGR